MSVTADQVQNDPQPLGEAAAEAQQGTNSPSKPTATVPVTLLESHSSTIQHHGATGPDMAPDKVLLDCCRESQPLNRFYPAPTFQQTYSLQRKGSMGSMLHDGSSLPPRGRSHSQMDVTTASEPSLPRGESMENPLTLDD